MPIGTGGLDIKERTYNCNAQDEPYDDPYFTERTTWRVFDETTMEYVGSFKKGEAWIVQGYLLDEQQQATVKLECGKSYTAF